MKISVLKAVCAGLVVFLIMAGALGAANAAEIDLKITSLTNIKGNGAIETCGTAIHSKGIKPLVVSVKHNGSTYSMLTSEMGEWCALVKRWTFKGEIEAYATTLDGAQKSEVQIMGIVQVNKK